MAWETTQYFYDLLVVVQEVGLDGCTLSQVDMLNLDGAKQLP